jgi:hypothetical protein
MVKFTQKHFRILAELIGKAQDLDEFYRGLVKTLQTDNPKFDVERFYKAVQKAHQFSGNDYGMPNMS